MLTEKGAQFLHYIHLQCANEQHLLCQLAEQEHPLRIGSTLSISDYYLPSILATQMESGTHGIHVLVANTQTLLKKLLEGALDAVFIEGIFNRTLFASEVFCNAPFVPVVRKGHPLIGTQVNLEHLHDYPLILRESGSGTRAICEHYLALQNDAPQSFADIWEIGSFALIKALIKQTDAISFMYEGVAEEGVRNGTLDILNIRDYKIVHPLHFVYLKNSVERVRIQSFYNECGL